MDTYWSMVFNRLNRTTEALTVIANLVLLLACRTDLFGMNFG
ncbi:MAG TPA: hypothetical protein VNF24_10395 [Candidatus Acidoferrales bacterium]|nr:hypothetical protein [Candidatus Acidoferrales bacterium]